MTGLPEQKLDPDYPGDETEAERTQRRAALLRALTSEEIVDMVCDAQELGPALYVSVVMPYAEGVEPHSLDKDFLMERVREILVPRLDRHLEAHE